MSIPQHILSAHFTHTLRPIRKEETVREWEQSGVVHDLSPEFDTYLGETPTGAHRFKTERGLVYEVSPDAKWAKVTNA